MITAAQRHFLWSEGASGNLCTSGERCAGAIARAEEWGNGLRDYAPQCCRPRLGVPLHRADGPTIYAVARG